ncbi:hypothetical protein [Couchioplanes caeruleus]|uniref:Uncharacterized protein n=1 Tax=Couchioplanes caeruleus subsp. caeruleus TaxID=56427 RepID=A0A1K0FM50_9ACTN|nr:hypothetical protein [Couchioplanes caeruleus]OJF13919.1 hypothetical protein BG844_12515 [Couchioplanes caeruleus subsp. caeruleus]
MACSRGLAFDADVSSTDPAVVDRGAKLQHDSLVITHELGGTHFTGALSSARGYLAIWRNLWHDGEDLARHARGFMAHHLTARPA